MRRWRSLIVDTWGALAYKPAFQAAAEGRATRLPGSSGVSWVPEGDRRRLAAYTILAAYDSNQAAALLGVDGEDRREYGDASLIVDQTLSHLLGETQQIVIDGAEDDESSQQREALLREWADAEHLWMRMQHAERNAVLLGDTVNLLAWSRAKRRPVLKTIDPGFYFPVLSDVAIDGDEYPSRVHLAWEIPEDPATGRKGRLRRVTYELGPIDEDANSTRTYPWSSQPSATTCYLTDAEWDLDQIDNTGDIDALSLARARFRAKADGEVLNRLDLQLDFLPVVHIPNTINGAEHFGQSSLLSAAQLLDDLAAADTDSQRASAAPAAGPASDAGSARSARPPAPRT